MADAIEQTLRAKAEGQVRDFTKTTLVRDDGGLFQSTMAVGLADPAPPHAAVKVVGLSPGNRARGLPHIGGLIVLLDGDTGLPAAILDARWITAMRTAGMSLVAARRLADPASAAIGFVGCGEQAQAHLDAFRAEFPVRRISVIGRRPQSAAAFVARAEAQGLAARVASSPEDAVRNHDIVVSSVPAAADLAVNLSAEWLATGGFATLVDLGRSWRPDGFAAIAHRFTDDRALVAQGKRPLVPSGPYTGDLQSLVTGPATAFDPQSRAVFVFQGMALADLAAASLVLARAKAASLGTLLPQ